MFKVILSVLLICLTSNLAIKTVKVTELQAPAPGAAPNVNTPFMDYFWLQRFYPGKDPVNFLDQTELLNKRVFFILSDQALYYSEKKESIRQVIGKTIN
jgi:hypothetical protein